MALGLFADLIRRRVFRTAAVYAAVAWGLTEALTTVAEKLLFPDWVGMLIVIAFLVGFPVAMYLAWVFDITPEGVRRTQPGSMSGRVAITVSAVLLFGGTAGLFWLIYPGEPVRQDVLIVDPMEVDLPDDTIAVLPFVNATGDQGSDYFADGVAETLLHQLSRSASLRVIARDSSFQLRDARTDARTKAVRLNAGFLLDGSVQRSGETIRIIARLVDGESGEYLWSESFDGVVGDIFDIQDRIATAVERELAPGGEDERQAIRRHTASIEAWDLYLKGLHQLHTATPESLELAIGSFTQASVLDPQFALAIVGRANANVILAGISIADLESFSPLRVDFEYVQPAAFAGMVAAVDEAVGGDVRRALSLRPDLSEVQAAHGLYRFMMQEFGVAESSLNRALELNPNNAFALHVLGLMLAKVDRRAEALSMLRTASSLDALSYPLAFDLGIAYLHTGRPDLADEEWQRAIALDPSRRSVQRDGALYLLKAGLHELAVTRYIEALDVGGWSDEDYGFLAFVFSRLGDERLAQPLRQDLWDRFYAENQEDYGREFLAAYFQVSRDHLEPWSSEPAHSLARFDSLLELAPAGMEVNTGFLMIGVRYANAAGEFGRAAEILELVEARLVGQGWPFDPVYWFDEQMPAADALDMATAYMGLGHEMRASELIDATLVWLDELEAKGFVAIGMPAIRAKAHTLRGEPDLAIAHLSEFASRPGVTLTWIIEDPALAGIADDPRYIAIIDGIRERNLEISEQVQAMLSERGFELPVPTAGE